MGGAHGTAPPCEDPGVLSSVLDGSGRVGSSDAWAKLISDCFMGDNQRKGQYHGAD